MKIKFKDYNQQQNWLFPPSIEELIPENHPVRIVNGVIEQLDIRNLIESYNAEGQPSYNPKMMLKVMVYAYMDNIYSSRKIEKAMRENINFMWLSGNQVADHNTIARFRSKRLKGSFKDIFKQVVLLLAAEGLVNLKELYTDGTKIESVAGRYTFVWGNAIKTRKEKISQQLEELWTYAQSVADEEDRDPEPPNFKEVDPEKVKKTAKKINQILKQKKDADPKKRAKARYIEKNFPENLKRYKKQEEILQGRSSYSKTDPDATFMRMKDDHMMNGQLKPGYNAQISTNNQIIVNYTLHQQTNDTHTLKSHLENHQALYEELPEEITTDAGYGSEENYELLAQKEITAFVKYNTFDKEQGKTRKRKRDEFSRDNLFYNEEEDFYVCPMGQKMRKSGESRRKTTSGFTQVYTRYTAQNCNGCPLRGVCFKGKNNRSVQRNKSLETYKEMVRANLLSTIGEEKRKRRTADVEPTFAQLKHNRNFNRFTLRGLEKVEIEFGLHALAHNIKKKCA